MLRRRLRGLLASILGGAFTGGVAGAVLGAAFELSPGQLTVTPRIPGGAVSLLGLWGVVVGGLSGGVFGVLMMLAERGRGVHDLRGTRVAAWAVLASAPILLVSGASASLTAIGCGLSAAIGMTAVWLAKRGAPLESLPAEELADVEGISNGSTG
jgi:hypothetical protein